jgi:GNAT superfamily N-acetyltransferase
MSSKPALSAVEKLNTEHLVHSFKCGKNSLDLFIRKHALMNQIADSSQTYVVHRDRLVIGYYSLVYSEISLDDCPTQVRASMPTAFPVPVMRFARFAVLKSEQKQGLGRALLKDAFIRTIVAAEIAGLSAIVVDAIDDKMVAFYKELGFIECPTGERALMIPIQAVRDFIASTT